MLTLDDRGDLAGSELTRRCNAVLGEAAPLLDQNESGGEVVLLEGAAHIIPGQDIGGERAGVVASM
ncbi:hypothetical protein [Streptomyces spirodelae]|uniref:hypothetical protein n=1 Tax=Streptomyces spirodelae TaxID=2812904 RepID=UPI0027DCD888|nr:hypothetical protein [Streptomyces spirodelae]